jgi:glycosyltransferase involved in cell wall biosynthesis
MVINKKKVLIFIPEFPGLTETFIEREVSKLVDSTSLQVEVLSLKKGAGTLSKNVELITRYIKLELFHLLLAVKYLFIFPKRVLKALSIILGNKNRDLKDNLYLFVKALGYSVIFESYNPAIIYAHFMSESSTLALLVSIILNKELGISAHAKDVLQEHGPSDENVELITQKVLKAKFITVCNENAYNKLVRKCGVKYPKNLFLKYHGIDEKDLVEKIKTVPIVFHSKVPILFSIGRFVEKKGFTYLLEAAKYLTDKDIDFRLYIAGAPGPLYAGIKDLISILELDDKVELLGEGKGLSFDEILSYYKIADIFVLPSINIDKGDADGIPNVLIEAATLNIPIVTTDAGSIKELIGDKKEGLVVPQKDSISLGKALKSLIADKDLQKKLAKNAKKKALTMFNIDTNIKEIEKLLLG